MAREALAAPYMGLTEVQRRILAGIDVEPDGCWVWQRATNGGYGAMGVPGQQRVESTHRQAYRAWRGEIPQSLHLDHEVCDRPICCNPWHLEPKSSWANTSRSATNPFAVKHRSTHCLHGHEFTPENTYTHPSRGTRHCKQCKRDRDNAAYAVRVGRSVRTTHRSHA